MNIDFNTIQDQTNIIYSSTQELIDSMAVGDRKTVKDIVKSIVEKTKMSQTIVAGYVQVYLTNSREMSVRPGRNGGAYKLNLSSVESAKNPLPSSKINLIDVQDELEEENDE